MAIYMYKYNIIISEVQSTFIQWPEVSLPSLPDEPCHPRRNFIFPNDCNIRNRQDRLPNGIIKLAPWTASEGLKSNIFREEHAPRPPTLCFQFQHNNIIITYSKPDHFTFSGYGSVYTR